MMPARLEESKVLLRAQDWHAGARMKRDMQNSQQSLFAIYAGVAGGEGDESGGS